MIISEKILKIVCYRFLIYCIAFHPDYSFDDFEFAEVDGMWYYYSNAQATWGNAADDCYDNHLGSTLPVLKTEAQMQLAFDHHDNMGKMFHQLFFNLRNLFHLLIG